MNFPLELHFKILDYLDLNDLFNYRLSSKQFKNVVDNYPISELQFDFEMKKSNWFYTNQLFNFGYFMNKSRISFLNSSFNFNNLKCLSIKCEQIDLDILNQFNKLENLELHLIKLKNLNNELKLTNLKSLVINQIKNSIIINTPNLIAIKFINNYNLINNLEFIYSLKIEILHLNYYNEQLVFQFKNLKILKLLYNNYSNSSDNFSNNLLENLNSLQLIDIVDDIDIKKILDQKKQLNRLDLIICNRGNPVKTFDPTHFNSSFEEYLLKLDPLNDVIRYVSINYNNYLPKIGTNISINKFDSIRNINIYNYVEDENHLIFIIKNCRNLENLYIQNSGLNNQFYDQLSSLSLFSIDIDDSKLEIDFKFISKMFYLKRLTTTSDFNLDKSFKLDRLIYLETITFKINSNTIIINKLMNNRFSIETFKKLSIPDKTFKFNELVNWINYIRLKKNKIMIIDRSNVKRKRKIKDPVFSIWKKRTI